MGDSDPDTQFWKSSFFERNSRQTWGQREEDFLVGITKIYFRTHFDFRIFKWDTGTGPTFRVSVPIAVIFWNLVEGEKNC